MSERPIQLNLAAEQAINLLLLINNECENYSYSHPPLRIVELRDVVSQLDALLDSHFETPADTKAQDDALGYDTSGK